MRRTDVAAPALQSGHAAAPEVLTIVGSPSRTSLTASVAGYVTGRVAGQGFHTRTTAARELPPAALLAGDAAHPVIGSVVAAVERAAGLVIATPIYQGAYSGLLKSLLDVLPRHALQGKPILPLATGGSMAHVLVLDYALRPVLVAMGADHIVRGVFVHQRLVTVGRDGGITLDPDIEGPLERAVEVFTAALDVEGARSA
ncbi:NADPH-dependent FMN reductase [Actinomadura montaniterrae]|uniref:NADPH-dependent FMN reductase n=1 Tax=Actinomadura montaniterrae TaxID=1803903 RepID=A0A6L3VW97_9ACTN|nr:NADPH-dependent FMN reductase [Actinomadura montaniterrae]KAB2381574.1 NADPH-dependent FMN reductase [Actinomadura montaniterrae]